MSPFTASPPADAEDEVKALRRGRGPRRRSTRWSWPATAPTTCPYFAVPRYFEVLDDLPRTPTGRVQKFLLRDRGVTDATWDRVAAGFEVRR